MLTEIKIYLFVLSIIFILKIMMLDFSARLFQQNPEPLSYDNTTKVFIYLSLSYILTFLILM